MIKSCKFCKKPYETNRDYSYCCPDKVCQVSRKQEWRLLNKPPTAFEPKKCRFCKKKFVIRHQNANRRTHCYNPICEFKQKRRYDEERKALAREWRKTHKPKPKSDKKACQGHFAGCRQYIDNANRIYCSVCHGQAEHRYEIY